MKNNADKIESKLPNTEIKSKIPKISLEKINRRLNYNLAFKTSDSNEGNYFTNLKKNKLLELNKHRYTESEEVSEITYMQTFPDNQNDSYHQVKDIFRDKVLKQIEISSEKDFHFIKTMPNKSTSYINYNKPEEKNDSPFELILNIIKLFNDSTIILQTVLREKACNDIDVRAIFKNEDIDSISDSIIFLKETLHSNKVQNIENKYYFASNFNQKHNTNNRNDGNLNDNKAKFDKELIRRSNSRLFKIKRLFQKIKQTISLIENIQIDRSDEKSLIYSTEKYDENKLHLNKVCDLHCYFNTEEIEQEEEDFMPSSFRNCLESSDTVRINIPNFKPIKPLGIDLRSSYSGYLD